MITPPQNMNIRLDRGATLFRTSAALSHHFLGAADRFCGIETLRTGFGAVHDGVAAIEPERIFEAIQSLAGVLVAAVCKPAVGLEQDRRAEILVLVPPVARAGRGAAEAEDAFPHPVELGSMLGRLPPLAVRRRLVGLQPRFDQFILRIETAEIGDEILEYRHMWQRRDAAGAVFEAVHGR